MLKRYVVKNGVCVSVGNCVRCVGVRLCVCNKMVCA